MRNWEILIKKVLFKRALFDGFVNNYKPKIFEITYIIFI